jgi:hypothetical protein
VRLEDVVAAAAAVVVEVAEAVSWEAVVAVEELKAMGEVWVAMVAVVAVLVIQVAAAGWVAG